MRSSQLQKGKEEGGLALGEVVIQEEESLSLLLGTQGEDLCTQEEGGEFVGMEHQDDVLGAGPPKKVLSDDHLAVEIPETAHQISQGMIGFCISVFL